MGVRISTWYHRMPEKDPICQRISCCSRFPANEESSVRSAFTNRDTDIPIRITVCVCRELLMREEMTRTTAITRNPMKKAVTGSRNVPSTGSEIPDAITIAAPREAPLETPRV